MLVLKILILGGTSFLGPHLVQEFASRGHEVSLFTRGISNPDLFPDVEKLQGDRDKNLEALKGKKWDAVIDTSGHIPRMVEDSSNLLTDKTAHYTFISSISVYKNMQEIGLSENAPVCQLDDPNCETITEKTYGALKARCEKIIQNYFPEKALIIRPGLIVGPDDPTDRFVYWPWRFSQGGNILAPKTANQKVQFIDVRDLAKWIANMVEQQKIGIFNAVGLPVSFEEFLAECQKVSKKESTISWVSEDFLIEKGVKDWEEIPLWLSSARGMQGFFNICSDNAHLNGLKPHPLQETLSDSLIAYTIKNFDLPKKWLTSEKEARLLFLWFQKKYY